ncbi:MAG TPA: DinB family protein [Nocardioidaceae bacterium]|nr:DinB family protein [Nocardioidaceae bacterium]
MTEPNPDPVTDRKDPPFVAAERDMLDSWLDYHRDTLLSKCAGLDAAQLRTRSVPPSSLSLQGLVRHMTEVERSWFRRVLLDEEAAPLYYTDANEDGDFDDVDSADAVADFERFRAEVETCRGITAKHPDLDALGKRQRHGHDVSLRWIYVHMIEEYARHNGHADLLRERIDGATGE